MLKIEANWIDLRYLDALSTQDTLIHRLNPCVKLITTLVFILAVTASSKYEITGLIPFFLFPAVWFRSASCP